MSLPPAATGVTPAAWHFFYCLNEVVPVFYLLRIDARFLAEFLVVPEHHRTHIHWQPISFVLIGKILNAGRVKRVFKSTLSDGLGNVLADAGVYLFKHHPPAPAVKSARAVFGLQQGRQLGFEGLVLEVNKLNLHPGVRAFILLGRFLPDCADLRKALNMEDFDHGFGRCGP